MKIYLDEPIEIEFTKIHHTYYGTGYMADHYSSVLSVITPKQVTEPDRQHLEQVIEKLKLHRALYEKHRPDLMHDGLSVSDEAEGVGELQQPS